MPDQPRIGSPAAPKPQVIRTMMQDKFRSPRGVSNWLGAIVVIAVLIFLAAVLIFVR